MEERARQNKVWAVTTEDLADTAYMHTLCTHTGTKK